MTGCVEGGTIDTVELFLFGSEHNGWFPFTSAAEMVGDVIAFECRLERLDGIDGAVVW